VLVIYTRPFWFGTRWKICGSFLATRFRLFDDVLLHLFSHELTLTKGYVYRIFQKRRQQIELGESAKLQTLWLVYLQVNKETKQVTEHFNNIVGWY
jgi:hypothetical protein